MWETLKIATRTGVFCLKLPGMSWGRAAPQEPAHNGLVRPRKIPQCACQPRQAGPLTALEAPGPALRRGPFVPGPCALEVLGPCDCGGPKRRRIFAQHADRGWVRAPVTSTPSMRCRCASAALLVSARIRTFGVPFPASQAGALSGLRPAGYPESRSRSA